MKDRQHHDICPHHTITRRGHIRGRLRSAGGHVGVFRVEDTVSNIVLQSGVEIGGQCLVVVRRICLLTGVLWSYSGLEAVDQELFKEKCMISIKARSRILNLEGVMHH